MDVPRLIKGTSWFLLLLLCFIAIDTFGQYLHRVTTQKIINGLRANIYRHVLRAPLWQVETLGESRGEILSRMNSDINMVENIYTASLVTPLMFLVSGIGAFAGIWLVNPWLAFYLVALGMFSLVSQTLFSKYQRKFSGELQQHLAQLLITTNESFQWNMNIRLMNIYNGVQRLVSKKLSRYTGVAQNDALLQGSVAAVNGAVSVFQYVGVTVICLYFLELGQIKLEDITYTLQLAGLVTLAFSMLGNTWLALQGALASFSRIDVLLSLDEENLEAGISVNQKATDDVIIVENADICFNKNKRLSIKRPIHIPAQKITALCGISGGGKSSLCKTLLGFYPYDGKIIFMGNPLQNYSLKTLRGCIAYVPQNNVILAGTVEENLRLGCPENILPQDIELATYTACCHEWIDELPDRFSHYLGEGGITLSGGQRQTLALARALLQQKPVIILDESLSAVSKTNAHLILTRIKANYSNRTILLVTHEKEIIEQCDGYVTI